MLQITELQNTMKKQSILDIGRNKLGMMCVWFTLPNIFTLTEPFYIISIQFI